MLFCHDRLVRLRGYGCIIELPHDAGFLLHEVDAVLCFRKGGFAHFDLRLDIPRAELVRYAAEQAHRALFYLETVGCCCDVLLQLWVFGAKVVYLIGIQSALGVDRTLDIRDFLIGVCEGRGCVAQVFRRRPGLFTGLRHGC